MKERNTVEELTNLKHNGDLNSNHEVKTNPPKGILSQDAIKISNVDSIKLQKNKYQKLQSLHAQLLKRRQEQETMSESCDQKEKEYLELLNKIEEKQMEKNQKIKVKQNIEKQNLVLFQLKTSIEGVHGERQKISTENQKQLHHLMEQIQQKQEETASILKKRKQIVTEEDSHLIYFLKGQLYQKQQEYQSLEFQQQSYLDDTNVTEYLELKHTASQKKEKCLTLKEKKQRLKVSIKELKKKQFEINQWQSKQERQNEDVKEEIKNINDKIKKQISIDEKLRLQLLKKIQDIEAKKTHPMDLPYEDLRKLKEYNHELKVRMLQVRENYETEKEIIKDLIPFQVIEDLQKKIKKAQIYFEKIKNSPEENIQMEETIKKLERQKLQYEKEKKNQITELKEEIQSKQGYLIDVKATVKVLKKEAEHVKCKLQEYQNKYPQLLSNKKKNLKKVKDEKKRVEDKISQEKQPIEKQSFIQSVKEEEQVKKSTNKSTVMKGSKKLKNEQIPTLQHNNKDYDMVYIVKRKNWLQFWFIVVLLAFGIGYYSLKRHLGIW